MGTLRMDFAPFALSGVVYGCLLNHRPALAALGEAASQAPYKAPPQAPVLYVKPRNTLAACGDSVVVPTDTPALELGAHLGIVIGRPTCRVSPANALDHVAGYTLVADVSVPHSVYYRPSIRLKARDGFCPIGPVVVPRSAVADPDALTLDVHVDGTLVQRASTGDRMRSVAQLVADVSDFMTLQAGDLLLLGSALGAPQVRPGQSTRITAPGFGDLVNHFVAEGAAA